METIEQQYLDDLRFFNKTLKAMKGVVSLPDDQMAILDGILLKFFYHAGTIFELYKGTKIDELGAYYWDSSSAAVIVRPAAERFYSYLSKYENTGHSSLFQPLDMDTKDKQIEFYHSFMNFMRPLMFYMVMALIMQFPALEDDPTIKSEIHRRLPERSDYP